MGSQEEKNKGVVRKFYKFMNTGDGAILHEIADHDADMDNIPPGFETGPHGFYLWVTQGARQAMPDQVYTIIDMIAEGDNVAVWTTVTGKHTGDPLLGMPPLGGKMAINEVMFFKIKNEKILKTWTMVDKVTRQNQLSKKEENNEKSALDGNLKAGPF